jgi:DNA-binding transcriptional ArsR family regulator/catechol 2,3-dioxygenase-like lactoylglutathione lyase family enzyme
VDAVFRALGDPVRLALVDELAARNDQTLFELCMRLINRGHSLSRQAVAKHVAALRDAGLVRLTTSGRTTIHHLDPTVLVQAQARIAHLIKGAVMNITITTTSVLVDDQARALEFYTNTLGFVKKTDMPAGEFRWLTVVSQDARDGVELLLEPDEHPAAKVFKAALVEDGIPFTSFGVSDAAAEFERLSALGVRFTQPPMTMGPVTTAVLDDTCGNLIQIASMP